jgi:hypothetical protein
VTYKKPGSGYEKPAEILGMGLEKDVVDRYSSPARGKRRSDVLRMEEIQLLLSRQVRQLPKQSL